MGWGGVGVREPKKHLRRRLCLLVWGGEDDFILILVPSLTSMGTSGAKIMDDPEPDDDDDVPPSSPVQYSVPSSPPSPPAALFPPEYDIVPIVTAFTRRNIPPISSSNIPYNFGESDLDIFMPFLRVANDDDSPSSSSDVVLDSYRRFNSSHTVAYSMRDNADVL